MYHDVLNLLFLRGKPIGEYRYPFWQSAVLLTLIGLLDAALTLQAGSDGLNAGEIVLVEWVFVGCAALFLRWWLKKGERWNGQGDLFALLVLGSAAATVPSLLGELTGSHALRILFSLYALIIFVEALHKGTRVSRPYGLAGMMLLALLFVVGGVLLLGLSSAR